MVIKIHGWRLATLIVFSCVLGISWDGGPVREVSIALSLGSFLSGLLFGRIIERIVEVGDGTH